MQLTGKHSDIECSVHEERSQCTIPSGIKYLLARGFTAQVEADLARGLVFPEHPGSVAETRAYRLKSRASVFQGRQLSTEGFSSPARRA